MPDVFHDLNSLPTVGLLVGLELVLGVDNVLVVGLLAAGFPKVHRRRATVFGLSLALGFRIAAVAGFLGLMRLSAPVAGPLSARDLVVIAGGLFLIWKAVREIHREVERPSEADAPKQAPSSFALAVAQIALLDLVFSVDSIVAAVGLTAHLGLIVAAVVITFAIVLLAANRVSEFIRRNPSLRLLCLAFLVCIGASLVLDGVHQGFPRAYLYLPMCFALLVELLHQRRKRNLQGSRDQRPRPQQGKGTFK